jgi:hypothetical protein
MGLLNDLIRQAGITVSNEAEALQVARLFATLALTEEEPTVLGEGDVSTDSVGIVVDAWGQPCSTTLPAVTAVSNRERHSYSVTLCVIYKGLHEVPYAVRWDLLVTEDGELSPFEKQLQRLSVREPAS